MVSPIWWWKWWSRRGRRRRHQQNQRPQPFFNGPLYRQYLCAFMFICDCAQRRELPHFPFNYTKKVKSNKYTSQVRQQNSKWNFSLANHTRISFQRIHANIKTRSEGDKIRVWQTRIWVKKKKKTKSQPNWRFREMVCVVTVILFVNEPREKVSFWNISLRPQIPFHCSSEKLSHTCI